MSQQQITIIIAIDTTEALKANTLEGNIYLIDNLRNQGSEGEGTGQLVSAINGYHKLDGSQAEQPILNWLVSPINGLPNTLPKPFYVPQPVQPMHKHSTVTAGNDTDQPNNALVQLENTNCATGMVQDSRGHLHDTKIKLLTVKGEPFNVAANAASGQTSELSYMTPLITAITGEAVDQGVIFPAQYGSPVRLNGGWYWSASASTYKTGVFPYTLHLTLHRPCFSGHYLVWEPVKMTYKMSLKVTSTLKNNGFTNGVMGVLPIG